MPNFHTTREYFEFNIKPEKIEFNICICAADPSAEKLDKCPPSVTISVLCLNIGIFILIIYQAKISPPDKKYYLMDSEIYKKILIVWCWTLLSFTFYVEFTFVRSSPDGKQMLVWEIPSGKTTL